MDTIRYNYTNGNSITTEAICVTGEKGETGDDGINGDYLNIGTLLMAPEVHRLH